MKHLIALPVAILVAATVTAQAQSVPVTLQNAEVLDGTWKFPAAKPAN